MAQINLVPIVLGLHTCGAKRSGRMWRTRKQEKVRNQFWSAMKVTANYDHCNHHHYHTSESHYNTPASLQGDHHLVQFLNRLPNREKIWISTNNSIRRESFARVWKDNGILFWSQFLIGLEVDDSRRLECSVECRLERWRWDGNWKKIALTAQFWMWERWSVTSCVRSISHQTCWCLSNLMDELYVVWNII